MSGIDILFLTIQLIASYIWCRFRGKSFIIAISNQDIRQLGTGRNSGCENSGGIYLQQALLPEVGNVIMSSAFATPNDKFT